MEEWKDINGYEGWYQISNCGNVRSVDRTITFSDGRVRKYSGQIITRRSMTSSGYQQVILKKNGKSHYQYIHRLVAKAFIPNPSNKKTVNHKDENKLNNNASNLEWATQAENNTYNNLHHRRKYNYTDACKLKVNRMTANNRKPVAMIDKNGNILQVFSGIRIAANYIKRNECCVGQVCRGIGKTAGGHYWAFYDKDTNSLIIPHGHYLTRNKNHNDMVKESMQ